MVITNDAEANRCKDADDGTRTQRAEKKTIIAEKYENHREREKPSKQRNR